MKPAVITTLILVAMLPSCVKSRPATRYYSIAIGNATNTTVTGAQVEWTGFVSSAGHLVPQALKVEHFHEAAMPPRVWLGWDDGSGMPRHCDVDVSSYVKSKAWSVILFEIVGENAVVARTFRSYKQLAEERGAPAMPVACGGSGRRSSSSARRDYTIGMINETRERLDDASVTWDGFASLGGVLVPGGEKTDSGIVEPMPTGVDVVWVDASGRSHRERVDVSDDRVGRAWAAIYFVITGDGIVRVRTLRSFADPLPWKFRDIP